MKVAILVLLAFVTGSLARHECIHNKLEKKITEVDFSHKKGFRSLEERNLQTYQPIRIYVDYSNIQSGNAELKDYLQNELMPSALAYYKASLKVKPETTNLDFSKTCGGLMPPQEVINGVDTDLVILVTAVYSNENYLAYAQACSVNLATGRPIYGMINFNLRLLPNENPSDKHENFLTTIHEIAHVLGFSDVLYSYYKNPSTNQAVNPLKWKYWNGINTTYLDVSPLTSKLQAHFGCNTLEGGYLENEGGSGSAGSHWERQIFMNDYMTASSVTDCVITPFTFALFEGTGWYQVDYTYTEPFYWGKSKGCDFVNKLCVENKTPTATPEFCPSLQAEGCSFTGKAVSYCGTYNAQYTGNPGYSIFNYWGNKTLVLDSFVNNCPYMIMYSGMDCEEPNFKANAALGQYEVYGVGSRCIEGTLSANGSPRDNTGFCFPIKCSGSAGSYTLTITVGSKTVSCTSAGTKSISGLSGQLTCPNPNDYCPKANPNRCVRGCSGRGTCSTTCQCPDGWNGVDCILRKTVLNCTRCANTGDPLNSACYGDRCCDPDAGTCFATKIMGMSLMTLICLIGALLLN